MWAGPAPWKGVKPVEKQQRSCVWINLEEEGLRCLSKQVREVLEKALTGRGRQGSARIARARSRPGGWTRHESAVIHQSPGSPHQLPALRSTQGGQCLPSWGCSHITVTESQEAEAQIQRPKRWRQGHLTQGGRACGGQHLRRCEQARLMHHLRVVRALGKEGCPEEGFGHFFISSTLDQIRFSLQCPPTVAFPGPERGCMVCSPRAGVLRASGVGWWEGKPLRHGHCPPSRDQDLLSTGTAYIVEHRARLPRELQMEE